MGEVHLAQDLKLDHANGLACRNSESWQLAMDPMCPT